jgi:hypothetical protein
MNQVSKSLGFLVTLSTLKMDVMFFFFRNISWLLTYYTALYPRMQSNSYPTCENLKSHIVSYPVNFPYNTNSTHKIEFRLEMFKAVTLKAAVIWGLTPCNCEEIGFFEGTYNFCVHYLRVCQAKNQ